MIGIFDSGSGGLGVLREIRKRAPMIDAIYLGDIKNAPYGSRSREELGALTTLSVERLLREGATKIVSACNSVSASIVLPMIDILGVRPFDMIEMVGPTVKSFRGSKQKILLVATPATVESGIYRNAFKTIGIEIEELAIENLAGAIEFGESDEAIKAKIESAFSTLDATRYALIILGCTHYPLVREIFEKVLKEKEITAKVFDPAAAVAEEAVTRFGVEGSGTTRFLITKDSDQFRTRVSKLFLENSYTIEVI